MTEQASITVEFKITVPGYLCIGCAWIAWVLNVDIDVERVVETVVTRHTRLRIGGGRWQRPRVDHRD